MKTVRSVAALSAVFGEPSQDRNPHCEGGSNRIVAWRQDGYAIFYNEIMEMHPSPTFTVDGWVHSNGKMYVSPDGGNGTFELLCIAAVAAGILLLAGRRRVLSLVRRRSAAGDRSGRRT